MRWQDPELSAIDEWREAHDIATRPEAIRRLVELGLSKSTSSKKPRVLSTAKQGAERAVELATDVIGKQMPNTSDEEKATRRRRLIKGPSEFRNVRRDRPQ
ncbi:hypothetical protein [Bradyrhizobium valentinum]|uniref:Uncharacterized protein n=1 Tax=Bradyrhizobium valentinum TaxID=1518501 RepID=A0A0R3LM45_9BRAD|nr:hypothetical protein [Bradyrhizobium valentinum]KRR06821.1 hypothetical protein CP49_01570 [Bradyrhizobium valentinum]